MTDLSRAADTLGYSAVIPRGDQRIYLHNQRTGLVEVMRPDGVSKNWLHYLMRTAEYRAWVVGSASGSTVKHTSPSRICDYEFDLPALEEQREAAAILDVLEARLNLLRQTNATLSSIAQSVFKSWFIDFDPVRAKADGREPEGMDAVTAALFPDSFDETELGLVPKGWSVKPVYELAKFINGAAYKAFEPNVERRGLPIIKIAELKSGVTSQTAYSDVDMPSKYLIETGDILFSWSGNPDTSIDTFVWAHAPAWLNQHIFRVVPNRTGERNYLLQLLRHLKPVFAELARNKQTTGLGHVTVADLKRLMVAWPDSKAMATFAEIGGSIQQRMLANEQQANLLAVLRDTLLPRLISGKLRLPAAEVQLNEAAE
ncbi:restriction endonuclease subunit S [Bradyrhizobium diazoefficiens]